MSTSLLGMLSPAARPLKSASKNLVSVFISIAFMLLAWLPGQAADGASLSSTNMAPAVNATFTVSVTLSEASAFSCWGEAVRFDNAKLRLVAMATGAFTTFVPDSRATDDINTSGEVRCGGFYQTGNPATYPDNTFTAGTVALLTFTRIAAGSTTVATFAKDDAADGYANDEFGWVLIRADNTARTPSGCPAAIILTDPLSTYAVTYSANSATSGTAPAAQTKTQDIALTLATNSGSLARTGYTFAGWNTAANATGTDYAVGASYTANAAVTLYAKWTASTYAVTYSANSATTGTAPTAQTKTQDITLTLATNSGSLAQAGYTFEGWNTAANGTETDYAVGASYTANAAVVLYAKWSVVTIQDGVETPGIVSVDGTGGGGCGAGAIMGLLIAAISAASLRRRREGII